MARFIGTVREDAAREQRRVELHGDQNRRADDEAIDHDHAPLGGGLQGRADQHRDLEAAHRGECGQGLAAVGVQRQHARQHPEFARHAGVVQAGAAADAGGDVVAAKPRQQQRSARGVADAHFTEQQHVARQAAHHLAAVLNGLRALRRAHRRAERGIGGTGADLAVEQPGARRKAVVHTGIDHRQRQPVLARQHADGGAAGEEVLDHLRRDLARVGRHALRRQTMVGREDDELRRGQLRRVGALDQADLHGQRFEPTERAARLGELVEAVLQTLLQALRKVCR